MGTFSVTIGTRSEIGEVFFWQQANLRYRVFLNRLHWKLPDANPETQLELDQYDHKDTIYILCGNPVIACCRLIPTLNRHMITELWPELLNGRILGQSDVWEVSRFAVDTKSPGASSLATAEMLLAGFLYATERGITRLIVVTSSPFERLLRTLGVCLQRWGRIRDHDGSPIIAGEACLSHEMQTALLSNQVKFQTNFKEIALATA